MVRKQDVSRRISQRDVVDASLAGARPLALRCVNGWSSQRMTRSSPAFAGSIDAPSSDLARQAVEWDG